MIRLYKILEYKTFFKGSFGKKGVIYIINRGSWNTLLHLWYFFCLIFLEVEVQSVPSEVFGKLGENDEDD